MTTALNDEFFGGEDPVLFKAVSNATIDIDEAKGIVEAFAAAVGNKDSVNDIVAPGAFDASLSRRKPRVVWGHNWNEPIGKVLEIREVSSSDPRLPGKMKRAGVGGLYVKVQFNLKSERGREAFASVGFFGEDQEWSIGYKTLRADYDPGRQANVLKEVELYEVSPVLHGANQLTGTISVKDAQEGAESTMVWEEEAEEEKSMHGDHGNEEDYEKGGTGSTLHRAVSGVFGPTARILEVRGDKVTFARGNDPDEMYQTTYRVDGPRVMFTRPVRGRMKPVFVAVNPDPKPMMEHKPMVKRCNGDCACGGRKDDEEEAEAKSETSYTINISDGSTDNVWSFDTNSSTSSFSDNNFIVSERDEKAGRVLRRGNMDKLRQAMDIIEGVMSTGMREVEEKTFAEEYVENLAEVKNDMVAGTPETVIGVSLDIPVDGPERTEAILDALESHIEELDLAVVAPGSDSFENDEKGHVSVYLSSTEDLSGQIEALSGALGDTDVSVSKKDFFGEPKTFDEVFPELKVLR